MSDRLDQTKKNIGLTNLDDKEKKDLFDKFVEGGGKVVQEKKRRGFQDFDRDKQKKYSSQIEKSNKKIKQEYPKSRTGKAPPQKVHVKEYKPAKEKAPSVSSFARFFHRLRIRFRLYFMGVSDFAVMYFNNKFLEKFNKEVKPGLLEFQLIFLDIFQKKHSTGAAITDELDKVNSLYYELMEMTAWIFDRTLINQITEHYVNFSHVPQNVSDLRNPLMELFKKLYVLSPYYEFILYAYDRAITLQMNIEKGKSSVYAIKRKKIKNNLFIVFRKFYMSLYWLFCYYNEYIVPLDDPVIESLLSIEDSDIPGKRERMKNAMPGEGTGTAGEGEEKQQEEDSVPPHVRKGLEMMVKLDVENLRTKHCTNDVLKAYSKNDRILNAYILFCEFDEEFSFILTTNKIKFNVQFTSNGKIDYKLHLSDLYDELRKCMKMFQDYTDVLEAFEKTRLEKPTSSAHYMDYSNRLTNMDKKRQMIGKNVRMAVRGFLEKVVKELEILLRDLNDQQKIISNPQEVLHFDSDIEGQKKLKEKKVYEALIITYQFVSALIFRLSPAGDLYGDVEMKEDEIQQIEKKMVHEEGQKADTVTKPKEKNDETGIINELDDLF